MGMGITSPSFSPTSPWDDPINPPWAVPWGLPKPAGIVLPQRDPTMPPLSPAAQEAARQEEADALVHPLRRAYDEARTPIDYEVSRAPSYRGYRPADAPEFQDWTPSRSGPEFQQHNPLDAYQVTDRPDFYGEYADATGAQDYGGTDIQKYVQQAQDAQQRYLNERFTQDAQKGLAGLGAMGLGSSSASQKFLQQNNRDLAEISNRYGANAQLQGLGLYYNDRNRYADRLQQMWGQENQIGAQGRNLDQQLGYNQNQFMNNFNLAQYNQDMAREQGQNQFKNNFNFDTWNQQEGRNQAQNQFMNQFNMNRWGAQEDRKYATAVTNKKNSWNMFNTLNDDKRINDARAFEVANQPRQTDEGLGGGQPYIQPAQPGWIDYGKKIVDITTGINELRS